MQKFLLPDFSTVMLGLIEYGETNACFEQYSGGKYTFLQLHYYFTKSKPPVGRVVLILQNAYEVF